MNKFTLRANKVIQAVAQGSIHNTIKRLPKELGVSTYSVEVYGKHFELAINIGNSPGTSAVLLEVFDHPAVKKLKDEVASLDSKAKLVVRLSDLKELILSVIGNLPEDTKKIVEILGEN